jgi:hypothetical protein
MSDSYQSLLTSHVRNKKAEEESGEEAAEVSGHADSRSDDIEGQLKKDYDKDVAQALSSAGKVTVAKEKAGPGSDHAHDTAGGTDELHRIEQS